MRLMSYRIETEEGWLEISEIKGKTLVELAIKNTEGDNSFCTLNREGFNELTRLSYDIFLEDPPEDPPEDPAHFEKLFTEED